MVLVGGIHEEALEIDILKLLHLPSLSQILKLLRRAFQMSN
jgi:hypothetical protein